METLIKQAFQHVDVIGERVHQGHYDLTGPDGEIVLPQVWEVIVQPDWEVSMNMWPMPDREKEREVEEILDPLASLGLVDLDISYPKKKSNIKKSKRKDSVFDFGPLPPPPNFPPAMPDPLAMLGLNFPHGTLPIEEKKPESRVKNWAARIPMVGRRSRSKSMPLQSRG
jgi:hypothetical protein